MSTHIDEIIERMSIFLNNPLTDADVAREFSVGRSNVSQWRKREYVPYAEVVAWGQREGLSLDYLINGDYSNAPEFIRQRELENMELKNAMDQIMKAEMDETQSTSKNGINPKAKNQLKVSNAKPFSISFENEYTLIPMLDVEASAGHGSIVISEEYESTVIFSNSWLKSNGLRKNDLVIIKARGDSMNPTISNNDVLVIDRNIHDSFQDGIYVFSYENELYVKRLQRQLNGGFKVISDNPLYESQVIEAKETRNLFIVGKVVWLCKNI